MSEQRNIVEVAGDDFIRRIEAGENPSIAQYEKQYPDAASELRDFLGAIQVVHRFKGDLLTSSSNPIDQPTQEVGFPRIGDYKVVREIGRGGMGVVYEAHQASLDRKVALKVLPEFGHGSDKAKMRFQIEARAAAKLNHANIVPVHEVGEYGDSLYYAMQLIDGHGLNDVMVHVAKCLNGSKKTSGHQKGSPKASPADSLAELLAYSVTSETEAPVILEVADGTFDEATMDSRAISGDKTDSSFAVPDLPQTSAGEAEATQDHSSFSVHSNEETKPNAMAASSTGVSSSTHRVYCKRVARIGVNVASALQYAHDNKVIHRDIKPANLLLDTNGTVWIADFGLAKTENSNLTRTGDIVGTLRYMSPERFKGECDETSDIYALGMTIYEMLAFQPAFPAQDRANLIDKILNDQPTPLGEIDSRIPLDLETIVHKAMAKDADRRYASAKLLADDLQRFLDGKPILARPVGTFERIAIWARKNKFVAALLSLLFAFLVATTAASTWGAITFKRMASESKTDSERATLAAERANKLADEAKAATKLANEEAEAVREINNFYNVEILSKGNPEAGSLDPSTTLLSVVDSATADIEGRFEDRPAVRGQILRSIGSTFAGLGQFDKAQKFLNDSYSILDSEFGEGDLRTLETLQQLAMLEFRERHTKENPNLKPLQAKLEKIVRVRKEKLGAEHPRTLDALFSLVEVQAVTDSVLGSQRMNEVWLARKKTLGEKDRDTLKAQIESQFYLIDSDQLMKVSEPELANLVALTRKELGEKDLYTMKARQNLGMFLSRTGQVYESLVIFEENVKETERWLGKLHPLTLSNMNYSSRQQSSYLEDVETAEFREELLKRTKAASRSSKEVVARSLELAEAFVRIGHLDKVYLDRAELLVTPIFKTQLKKHPDHPDPSIEASLFDIFTAGRKLEKAVMHGERLLDCSLQAQGEAFYQSDKVGQLLDIYDRQGAHQKAIELLEKRIASFEKLETVKTDAMADINRIGYSRCLSKVGKFKEAKESALMFLHPPQRNRKDWRSETSDSRLLELRGKAKAALEFALVSLGEMKESDSLLTPEESVAVMKDKAISLGNEFKRLSGWRKWEEALEKVHQAKKLMLDVEKLAGEGSFRTAGTLGNRAAVQSKEIQSYIELEQFEEALAATDKALSESNLKKIKSVYFEPTVSIFRGRALVGLKRYEQAEEVLTSSYRHLHANNTFYRLNQKVIKEFGCSASKALVDLYEQTGQLEKKQRWECTLKLDEELHSINIGFLVPYNATRYKDALQMLERGLDLIAKEETLDDRLHYFRSRFQIYSAVSYNELGDFENTLRICENALKIDFWPPGKDYYKYRIQASKGQALLGLKKHEEAEPLLLSSYRELSDDGRKTYSRQIARSLVELYRETNPEKRKAWELTLLCRLKTTEYMALFKQNKFRQCSTVIESILAQFAEIEALGDELVYFKARFRLYLMRSQIELSEFEKIVEVSQKALNEDAWPAGKPYYKQRFESLQGQAFLGLKRYEEAERILLSSFEGFKARGLFGYSKPVARSLIELYQQTGKPEKLKQWEENLKQLNRISNADS